ncbi:MAG TPA: metallophosphoesterase family protein [Puia sp.]|jgi:predicted phosphodiesterase
MQRLFSLALLISIVLNGYSQDAVFIAKPYLQIGRHPSPTTLELMWHTPDAPGDWVLEIKTTPTGKWIRTDAPQYITATPDSARPRRVYHALLSGLAPGGVFSYRLLLAGKTVFTADGKAPKGENQPYRFVVNGDIGAATPDARLLARQSFLSKPDLVVIPGDIIYENGRVSEYDEKFWPVYNADQASDQGAPVMRSIPYIGAPGNHDVDNRNLNQFPDGLAYFYFWRQPLNGPAGKEGGAFVPTMTATEAHRKTFLAAAGDAYPNAVNYSFNYGNAHWTVVDSDPYVDWTDSALRAWVAADLAAEQGAAWRFVIFHHPGFSSALEHYEQQQMRLLSPIFETGKVDVVFSGHVHNYQRNYPLTFAPFKKPVLLMGGKDNKTIRGRVVNGYWMLDKAFDGKTNTRPKGVLYIITGAGGQELYNPEQTDQPDTWQKYTSKFIASVHSLTVVDVNGRNFTLRQVSTDGTEVDAIKITK